MSPPQAEGSPVSAAERFTRARAAAGLLAGIVFGVGLAAAQMTDPRKVLNFLDITGTWDPSLLFVMGGAVMFAATGFALVRRRAVPWLDDRFHISAATAPDAPLLTGAALFGVGWGLAGYCPGPAIASLGFANTEAYWLVPAMLIGLAFQRWQAVHRAPSTQLV